MGYHVIDGITTRDGSTIVGTTRFVVLDNPSVDLGHGLADPLVRRSPNGMGGASVIRAPAAPRQRPPRRAALSES